MRQIKVLYHFSSDEIEVIEIKRLGLQNASPSETYKWLVINKEKGLIEELSFISMTKNLNDEERVFKQGSLTFNDKNARLVYFDQIYELQKLNVEEFPNPFGELVETFVLSN